MIRGERINAQFVLILVHVNTYTTFNFQSTNSIPLKKRILLQSTIRVFFCLVVTLD